MSKELQEIMSLFWRTYAKNAAGRVEFEEYSIAYCNIAKALLGGKLFNLDQCRQQVGQDWTKDSEEHSGGLRTMSFQGHIRSQSELLSTWKAKSASQGTNLLVSLFHRVAAPREGYAGNGPRGFIWRQLENVVEDEQLDETELAAVRRDASLTLDITLVEQGYRPSSTGTRRNNTKADDKRHPYLSEELGAWGELDPPLVFSSRPQLPTDTEPRPTTGGRRAGTPARTKVAHNRLATPHERPATDERQPTTSVTTASKKQNSSGTISGTEDGTSVARPDVSTDDIVMPTDLETSTNRDRTHQSRENENKDIKKLATASTSLIDNDYQETSTTPDPVADQGAALELQANEKRGTPESVTENIKGAQNRDNESEVVESVEDGEDFDGGSDAVAAVTSSYAAFHLHTTFADQITTKQSAAHDLAVVKSEISTTDPTTLKKDIITPRLKSTIIGDLDSPKHTGDDGTQASDRSRSISPRKTAGSRRRPRTRGEETFIWGNRNVELDVVGTQVVQDKFSFSLIDKLENHENPNRIQFESLIGGTLHDTNTTTCTPNSHFLVLCETQAEGNKRIHTYTYIYI